MTTTPTAIALTTLTIAPFRLHGEDGVEPTVTVSVSVDAEDGKFRATMNDQEYEAESLSGLRGDLVAAVTAAKLNVPFVTTKGERGTVRGWHAGNHDVLVTWADGSKGRIGTWDTVARDATPEQLQALAEARDRFDKADAARREAEKALNAVKLRDGIRVTELMLEELGFDVTSREFREEVKHA